MDNEIRKYQRALRQSGKDVLAIDRNLLGELDNVLTSLTHYYIYNSNGPDYSCLFCGEEPENNQGGIKHRTDCLGQRLSQAIHEADAET